MIYTIKKLGTILSAAPIRLEDIARNRDLLYRPFDLYRRGKHRCIDRPVEPLKSIQRLLYRLLLRDYRFTDAVHAGVSGRSIFGAVLPHVGRPLLVTLDIKNFFPSISQSDVYHVWREKIGCSAVVSRLLAELTTFRGYLPQGAATSMALANIFMIPADLQISLQLSAYKLARYTRWVDDLMISGQFEDPSVIFHIVADSIRPLHLKVNSVRTKSRVMRRYRPQLALGLSLNDKIGIPRTKRANVRAAVHVLLTRKEGRVASLVGRLQFVARSHPEMAKRLLVAVRGMVATQSAEHHTLDSGK